MAGTGSDSFDFVWDPTFPSGFDHFDRCCCCLWVYFCQVRSTFIIMYCFILFSLALLLHDLTSVFVAVSEYLIFSIYCKYPPTYAHVFYSQVGWWTFRISPWCGNPTVGRHIRTIWTHMEPKSSSTHVVESYTLHKFIIDVPSSSLESHATCTYFNQLH